MSSFGAWWGDSLTCPRLDIFCRHSVRGGDILLLTPGWTSLVIIRRVVGRFSYSPQDGHLSSLFGAWWGDSLTHPRLGIFCRHLARGGEILLLTPGCTSLVVIRHAVGRFSYSPQAGHLSSLFSAWWGDSLTRPRLDISRHCSARGGEILLLAPGWTSLIVVRRVVGRFSYSPQAGHLSLSFGAWWGRFCYSPHAGHLSSSFGAWWEILLLTPGWTSLFIIRSVVGRFSYSPQAGHLLSSFGTWWGRFSYSPRAGHFILNRRVVWRFSYSAGLDISRHHLVRGGEILLLAPGWTSLVIIRSMVGRFSYSPHVRHLSFIIRRVVGRFYYLPHATHLSSSFGACWGDSLARPMLDISHYHSARGGEILLLTPCWTSLIIVRRVVGRFSYSPQARCLLSFGA